jgi:hypothetical protein
MRPFYINTPRSYSTLHTTESHASLLNNRALLIQGAVTKPLTSVEYSHWNKREPVTPLFTTNREWLYYKILSFRSAKKAFSLQTAII